MISIDIQPYCDNCPAFKAFVDGPTKLYSEDDGVRRVDPVNIHFCDEQHQILANWPEKGENNAEN